MPTRFASPSGASGQRTSPPEPLGRLLPDPPSSGRISTAWRKRLRGDDWPRPALVSDFGRLGAFTLLGASQIGRSHAHEGLHRQDAYGFTQAGTSLVCAVADGVSGVELGAPAADVAVSHLLAALDGRLAPDDRPIAEDRLRAAVEHARVAVEDLVRELGLDPARATPCATTLAVAVLDPPRGGSLRTVCASVGDSGVLSLTAAGELDVVVGADHAPDGRLRDFLPRPGSKVDVVEVELAADTKLVLGTDGLIEDLELSEAVRRWVVRRLSEASSPVDAAHVLSYERQGSDDDLTYLAAGVSEPAG